MPPDRAALRLVTAAEPGAPRTLSIICPVYRERESIAEFHRRLSAVLDGLRPRYESTIVYVVDPSPDGTVEAVRDVVASTRATRAIVMSRRFGHQMAILAGIDASDADAVVMMDSDLQHPPELIPALVEQYEAGFDVVQTVRSATVDLPWSNRVMSRSFYRILNFLSDTEIVEGGADFRLLSRRVVELFQHKIREQNQFLRGLVPWVGFPTATVDFVADARMAGQTSYSMKRMVRLAADGLVSLSKTPLRFGTLSGLTLEVLAFVYLVTALVVWLATGSSPAGWVNLAVVMVACTGLLLIFMTVLGWYIGAILDEVKARPHYIVAEDLRSPDCGSAG